MKVLILGGTSEATALAAALRDEQGIESISSLAGRTRRPGPIEGRVRIGGFGGSHGLLHYLRNADIAAVVDATHPYASEISRHAAQACGIANVPRLQLCRLPWKPEPGERWMTVPSMTEVPRVLTTLPQAHTGTVFLSTGRKDLEAFSNCATMKFAVRLIDPPASQLPLVRYELVLGRGPFSAADEMGLFVRLGVSVLVSKNSGGTATHAKLAAANHLNVPVVMVDRPAREAGLVVNDVAAAKDWIVTL